MTQGSELDADHARTDDVLWESVINALIWGFVAILTLVVWKGGSASPAEVVMTFFDVSQTLVFVVSCVMAWTLVRLLGRFFGGQADKKNGQYFGRLALFEIGATLTTAGSVLIACTILGGGFTLLLFSFLAYYYGYLFRSEFSPSHGSSVGLAGA